MSWRPLQIAILVLTWVLPLRVFSGGQPLHILEGEGIAVHYEASLEKAAQEVMGIYPSVEDELWRLFDWRPEPRPLIVITEGKEPFFGVEWEKTPISAFAAPGRGLTVLNWSRVGRDPMRLHDVLKHEVCHIIMHQRITALPRWLDEGVCQWASDGVSELLAGPRPPHLTEAVSAGTIIPLDQLETGFPSREQDLLLAYEESKGFVVYLVNRFGKSGLIRVLKHAAEGDTARVGLQKVTAETLEALERDWRTSLKGGFWWLVRISHYLYQILFVLTALLAVWGFVRLVLKKRAYRDNAPESGRNGHP